MASILTRTRWSFFTARKVLGETRIAYLPPEELEALQSSKLRSIVRHAWERVPFYREWMRQAGAQPGDIRSAADLKRLPRVGKLELTLHPERFAAQGYEHKDGLTLYSSGTSGRRRTFRYDARALFQALAAGRRQRIVLRPFVGREAGYREAVFKGDESVSDRIRSFWEERTFTPRTIELTRRRFSPAMPFREILAGVNEFRPDVIRGIGSHVGAFLRWVCERGLHLEKPKAVTYGADAMPGADRKLIEEELRIPVFSTYQAVEALRIGFQCEARRGFHISTDQVIARVVDAGGHDVAPGERGELILSNLTNHALVVLNYGLGDLVTLGRGACECGRTLPLIEGIDGRLDDLLTRSDGTRVHALTVLPRLQAVAGVRQVQVVQEDLDEFLLRVVWARGSEHVPGELRARMASVLGEQIRISVESVDAIGQEPSGKVKSVICKVKRQ